MRQWRDTNKPEYRPLEDTDSRANLEGTIVTEWKLFWLRANREALGNNVAARPFSA